MSKRYDPIMAQFAEQDRAGDIATRAQSVDWYTSLGQTLPNPDPVLKKLGRDVDEYQKLLADARVQAAVTSRKAGSVAREWSLTSEGVDERQYEIVSAIFKKLDITRIIKESLDSVLFGYKPLEISWVKDGDLILPQRVIGKPSNWFRFGEENELRFLTKSNALRGEEVPDRKFLVAQNGASYENPYGNPVLSAVYWPVKFRHNGYKFWTIFLEKYGMPWILAKAPAGEQENRIQKTADMLTDMVADAIAVVPDGYDIQMVEGRKGDSADSYDKYMQSCSTEISIAILGTNLTTEVKGGSFAAARSHMEVRADIVDADTTIVVDIMNQLIDWIYQINWGSGKQPEFLMFESTDVDKEVAERDAILVEQVGVRFTEEYIAKTYDLQPGVDFTLSDSTVEPTAPGVPPIEPPPVEPPSIEPPTEDV